MVLKQLKTFHSDIFAIINKNNLYLYKEKMSQTGLFKVSYTFMIKENTQSFTNL